MRTSAVAVVLALSVSACTSPWVRDYGPNFPQSNPGEAALYLVRDATPADAAPISLTIGRRPVGSLTGLTYMRFDLQPRLYDLHAYGPQEGTEQIITVAPGQTRFIQVEATSTGGAQFLEVAPGDGRRMVRQGQRLQQMQDPPRD
jgi:hypothetical protein